MKRGDGPVSVYFVQAGGDEGLVKIGFAADVKKRVEMLQTGNPQRLLVLHALECVSERAARSLESSFHAMFAAERVPRSEWFRWCPELGKLLEALRAVERTWRGQPVNVQFNVRRPQGGGLAIEPTKRPA